MIFFTEDFVYSGRQVELRKGYSGESLWGHLGNIRTGTLEEIFDHFDYFQISRWFPLFQPNSIHCHDKQYPLLLCHISFAFS